MNYKYNIYLISDSTGETLDRIFMALKAQFKKFEHNLFQFSSFNSDVELEKLKAKNSKFKKYMDIEF